MHSLPSVAMDTIDLGSQKSDFFFQNVGLLHKSSIIRHTKQGLTRGIKVNFMTNIYIVLYFYKRRGINMESEKCG